MNIAFCGHSQLTDTETIRENLIQTLQSFPTDRTIAFYLGGYGDFDLLAASVLHRMKSHHPHFETILVLPYPDKKYDSYLYDTTLYPPIEAVPRKFAILKRNMWMVDCADIVIAYVVYPWGGAFKTYEYAKRKNRNIINLGNI